jgi:hypothetical protein
MPELIKNNKIINNFTQLIPKILGVTVLKVLLSALLILVA